MIRVACAGVGWKDGSSVPVPLACEVFRNAAGEKVGP